MASACAFGVKGMNRAPFQSANLCSRQNRFRSTYRCGSSPEHPCRRRPTGSNQSRLVLCPNLRAVSAHRRHLDHFDQGFGLAGVAFARRGRCSSESRQRPAACGQCAKALVCRWWQAFHGPARCRHQSMVVTPECKASSICCGQIKWMWLSIPPAVRIRPSPAMPRCPGRR